MRRSSDRFAQLLQIPSGAEDFKASTLRSGTYAMAGSAVDFVLRLGSVAVLARLLLPEHFGLIGMVTALTAIAERFKDLGLMTATIQSRTLDHKQSSALFWVNTALGAVIMIVICLTAYPIAKFYADSRLHGITIAIATTFLWSGAANQHYALLRRSMKYRQIAVIQVAGSALSIVVAIAMAIKGLGYWSLVAREITRNAFTSIGVWVCFPWVPGLPSRDSAVGGMLRFGVDITASNVLHVLSQSLDQVLIGRLFGPHLLGLYRQGYQLVLTPMSQISYPIRVVAESTLSRLQEDASRYRQYYSGILKTVSLATIPSALFMAVYAEEFVFFLLGEKWHEASSVFRLLAVAACLWPAAETVGAVMVSRGLSRRYFWLGSLSAGSISLLFVAGLPFGIEGVASAHILAVWLLLVPKLHFGFKNTPVRVGDFLACVGRPALAALVMTGLLGILRSMKLTGTAGSSLLLGLGIALAIFLLTFAALPGGRSDLAAILRNIKAQFNLNIRN